MGYKKAQYELHEQAEFAVDSTLAYIQKDGLKIKNNESCDDVYMIDKQVISMLPRWTLRLLGTEYVLRCPLRKQWKTMWLMTKEKSIYIDNEITRMFKNTMYEICHVQKKNEVKLQLEQLYSSMTTYCTHKILQNKNDLNENLSR
jgi:hypothetical protein